MTNHTLPDPGFYKKSFPLDPAFAQHIQKAKASLQKTLSTQERFVVVVGPCSVHDVHATIEYAEKLAHLQKQCPSLFIIMRAYFDKPRTRLGWRGMGSDPFLNGSNDIVFGIELVRKLLLEITRLGLPIATEFVDVNFYPYLSDLITLSMVGARTTTAWPYRALASLDTMPVGFKNTTSGSIANAIDAMAVANQSHDFTMLDQEGHLVQLSSEGNPHTFLTLRGSSDRPNYDLDSVIQASHNLKKENLCPYVLVDCGHGNAKHGASPIEVCETLINNPAYRPYLLGVMLESFLKEGKTSIENKTRDRSITDPCIGFEKTADLLKKLDQSLSKSSSSHQS